MKKLAILTACSLVSAASFAAAIPENVKKSSSCAAAFVVNAEFMSQAGDASTAETLRGQGLNWAQTAIKLGERRGLPKQVVVDLNGKNVSQLVNQVKSKQTTAAITMLNDKMRACIQYIKQDQETLAVYREVAN